jgi:hypothetical protein
MAFGQAFPSVQCPQTQTSAAAKLDRNAQLLQKCGGGGAQKLYPTKIFKDPLLHTQSVQKQTHASPSEVCKGFAMHPMRMSRRGQPQHTTIANLLCSVILPICKMLRCFESSLRTYFLITSNRYTGSGLMADEPAAQERPRSVVHTAHRTR